MDMVDNSSLLNNIPFKFVFIRYQRTVSTSAPGTTPAASTQKAGKQLRPGKYGKSTRYIYIYILGKPLVFNIYISSFEVFLTIRVPPTIGVPFKDQQVWMTLGPSFGNT